MKDTVPRDFRAAKDATFLQPPSREHMVNTDDVATAVGHGTGGRYGAQVHTKRPKRAHGGKALGGVTGKAVRQRFDRAKRRKYRADAVKRADTKRAVGGNVPAIVGPLAPDEGIVKKPRSNIGYDRNAIHPDDVMRGYFSSDRYEDI
jgi:hypothetical protein